MEYRALSITLWFFAILIAIYAVPQMLLGILGLFMAREPYAIGYALGHLIMDTLLGLLAYWMTKKAINFWRDADLIKHGPR